MISLKVNKRSTVINNLLMFVLLSVIFVHVMESFSLGASAISIEAISFFARNHFLLITAMFVTLLSVLKVLPFSKFLLAFFFSVVIYYSLNAFILHFDKLILTYVFLYVAIAGYFFIFWYFELSEAAYRPNYIKEHIGKKSFQNLSVNIIQNEQTFAGYLTNWDIETCFICVEDTNKIVGGTMLIELKFEDFDFSQPAELVATYSGGIGVRFLATEEGCTTHSWMEFYEVLKDRGLSTRNI